MQAIGLFILAIAIWLGYCGTQSFNPLGLARAILKDPSNASETISDAKTYRDGNPVTTDTYAGDTTPTSTGGDGTTNATTPTDVQSLGSFEAAHAADLNSQNYNDASVAIYKQYAFDLLQSKGVGGTSQYQALTALWNQESGWNPKALNRSSGAFGIPQALPATKIPGGQGASAAAQINWGIDYILGRYGSPIAAEAHEKANNWY